MPNRHLVANWKMNLPPEGMDAYVSAVARASGASTQIVIAPPFPYLKELVALARAGIAVAAQNCGDHDKGAFTGEVSASMIRECGGRYVIVGHSERRTLYGESDVFIARKVEMAIASGLVPILCIGEDIRTRDAGRVSMFLADQVRAAGVGALEQAQEVIIAYEPIWAIGTGRNASGLMVAETVGQIREALRRSWPPRYSSSAPILYGGSVTPENVTDLTLNGQIDGYLVGGASLDSGKFLAILRGMR